MAKWPLFTNFTFQNVDYILTLKQKYQQNGFKPENGSLLYARMQA
jgi:hypothetical protein